MALSMMEALNAVFSTTSGGTLNLSYVGSVDAALVAHDWLEVAEIFDSVYDPVTKTIRVVEVGV